MFSFRAGKFRRRGTISLIILVLALSASAMISASLSMATGSATIGRRALMKEQALFLADAGLEYAMIYLRDEPAWRDGFTNQPLGAGSFTVTLADDGEDVLITSTGTIGPISVTLSTRVGWE